MKTAEEWVDENPDDVLWNSEVGREESIPVVRAIQADMLLHAAELCRQRIAQIKNEAHNIACTECAVTIEAEAYRLESP